MRFSWAATIVGVVSLLVAVVFGSLNYFKTGTPIINQRINGPGGKGGAAKAPRRHSGADGGAVGKGGLGAGGAGGNAEASGDHSFARGGDGGNAAQLDGSGGKRTLSPGERLNLPTSMWPYGYGGRGADAPEYRRRLEVLTRI